VQTVPVWLLGNLKLRRVAIEIETEDPELIVGPIREQRANHAGIDFDGLNDIVGLSHKNRI